MNLPADEQLLDQLRQWLTATRAEADAASADGDNLDGAGDDRSGNAGGLGEAQCGEAQRADVGLYRLAEEFTALRHEVKLQTRGARDLSEETERLLAALRDAIEALQSIESAPRPAPAELSAESSAAKGLALALADLDEALDRGRQQLHRGGQRLLSQPDESLEADIENAYAGQSWLVRWLARDYRRQVRARLAQAAASAERRDLFGTLLDGYALMQQRLSRSMASAGILRIAAVGQDVDPERMIVLEVVADGGTPGVVVEEIRRGYTWHGRLLRCAEVRATKFDSTGTT